MANREYRNNCVGVQKVREMNCSTAHQNPYAMLVSTFQLEHCFGINPNRR